MNINLNELPPREIDLNGPPHEDEEPTPIQFDTSELLSSDDEVTSDDETEVKKRKMLTNDQRYAIYAAVLQRSVNGKLKKTTTRNVASLFSVSIRTVQRIWKRSQETISSGVVNVSHRKTKNCGRKQVKFNLEQFRNMLLQQRTTLRGAATAMNMTTTLLHKNLKEGLIKRHSNAIKPFLTDDNKKARVQFCLSMLEMLERDSLPHDPTFKDMYNIIHIDEKWFDMSRKHEKYYLLSNEEEPYRTCKSKNFVPKVMFLAAIARPRFDAQGNEIFSGKLGIFPFVTKEPAKRSSVNRVAGTMETKPITSVKRDTIRSFLIEKVLPVIRQKWPRGEANLPIYIQQDNARTHIDIKDPEFCQAAQEDGFDIRLRCQPANSPDLNVLDLGFFRAIQSLKYQEAPRTIDELISGVEKAYETFPVTKSNHIFLTLQLCMESIIKEKGGNNYKIPHIDKAALERRKQLPVQIKIDTQLVQDALRT